MILGEISRFAPYFYFHLCELTIPIFLSSCYSFYIPELKGIPNMTNIVRNAEYRCFSFTYFYGKAYLGLAESVRV